MTKRARASSKKTTKASWHLARNANEAALSAIEISIEHLLQAYYRWKRTCLASVADGTFTGDDVGVLNVVRMGDQAKRLSDVARVLNRNDISNLQYSIRKLTRAGLIELDGRSKRDTRYRVTPSGRTITDAYAETRRTVLMPLMAAVKEDLAHHEGRARWLRLMASLYDQGSQAASERMLAVPQPEARLDLRSGARGERIAR